MTARAVRIEIAPRSVALVVATGLGLAAVWRFRELLALFAVGLTLACTLDPLVVRLERRHVPRGIAVVSVFAVIIATLALIGIAAGPELSVQATGFVAQLPKLGATVHNVVNGGLALFVGLQGRLPFLPRIQPSADGAAWVGRAVPSLLPTGLSVGTTFLHGLVDFLVAMLLAFFLMLGAPQLRTGLVALFPANRRLLVEEQLSPIAASLGAYARGQLISMGSLALILGVGLMLVRVPYAWVLALVAGVLEVVPWLGGSVGVLLASLVALTVGWQAVLLTWVVFAVAHVVQGDVLGPLILARVVQVPPLLVMVALLVGGELLGLLGAIVAVPVTAVAVVLVRNLWVPRMDRTSALSGPRADDPGRAAP